MAFLGRKRFVKIKDLTRHVFYQRAVRQIRSQFERNTNIFFGGSLGSVLGRGEWVSPDPRFLRRMILVPKMSL